MQVLLSRSTAYEGSTRTCLELAYQCRSPKPTGPCDKAYAEVALVAPPVRDPGGRGSRPTPPTPMGTRELRRDGPHIREKQGKPKLPSHVAWHWCLLIWTSYRAVIAGNASDILCELGGLLGGFLGMVEGCKICDGHSSLRIVVMKVQRRCVRERGRRDREVNANSSPGFCRMAKSRGRDGIGILRNFLSPRQSSLYLPAIL
jgi:hypothetical protein